MSFADILPIIYVVIFWIILAALALAFSRRALHAPTEAELEAQHAESSHPKASHRSNASNVSNAAGSNQVGALCVQRWTGTDFTSVTRAASITAQQGQLPCAEAGHSAVGWCRLIATW